MHYAVASAQLEIAVDRPVDYLTFERGWQPQKFRKPVTKAFSLTISQLGMCHCKWFIQVLPRTGVCVTGKMVYSVVSSN